MADAIEVPGETNPLTAQNLLNCLLAAASSVQQQVQIGAQQLQHWEKQVGFYPLLQEAYLDHSLPLEIRYLAIIQLKNGIDRYWRKTATNAIKKEDKEQIKSRALEAGIVEPAPLLALHNALVIAKILRYEFPSDEWPNALPFLISTLRSSAQPGAPPLQFPRTLIILLQIIKELSTARMQRVRASLQSASPEIFQLLGGIYVEKVNAWSALLEYNRLDDASLLELLEQTLISLKVIRRLIIAGFEHPHRDKDVQGFWTLSHTQFANFFGFSETMTNPPRVNTLIKKHLLQFSKLHVEMAKVHPAAFALLPDCVALVKSYWTVVSRLGEVYDAERASQSRQEKDADEGDEKNVIETLGLKALLLIRACAKMAFNPVHSFKYQQAQDKEERKDSVELIKSQLFTQDFVIMIMELIVSKFLRLRKVDFQEWEEEPEEWERKEDTMSEAWEFSVRPCSEKLFLDLIIHFKPLLVPQLLNVFYNFANPQNQDILMKDSLYSAIGLAAASLEQQLDFNAFIESALVPEVQINEQGYKVLRRRAAIVIGQWMPIQPEKMNRQYVYQIFQHLFNKADPVNDLPVRITAGRQLKNVLDPYEFSPQEFLPYATPILQNLLTLIQEVELSETKMALLETVRTAVVKMEDHILPFSDQIMSLLPPLWEQSGEEHLMKQAILTLLSSLMNALKSDSVKYHKDMLPLIQNSIEPDSETIVYLLDEALELWAAILTQTPAPASSDIISLFPRLLPIFEAATDSAPLALQIAESYILLCPREVLHDEIRVPFLASLETLLSAVQRQRLGVIPHLAEMLIRATEHIDGGSENSYNVIAKSLLDSSFLHAILDGLHSAYEASQSTGPNRKTSHIYANLETDYFSVLARLALANPRVFLSAISAAISTSEEQVLSWLLTEWFFHYDNIALVTQKKLHVLALTQLLAMNATQAPPPTYLLNHLQSYLTVWTDVVTELAEGSDELSALNNRDPHAARDYLIYWNPNSNTTDVTNNKNEPPENARRRQWENSDPVHSFNIRQFIQERLQAVMHACGGVQRFHEEWLVNVDRDVVNAFGSLGIL
ncbi:importin 11, putative [Talaromyces stipitatus ATCC 10500]|uniref:Importin 11, putative n=1 Tax=Talaromyces stipitatus (strain ATCC 10500 / CBS 375.48 / QM 6759 / NRRL 1006) TaxID=441959 RepID=B8MFD6_TALSN|nr:importin 11, putative [Talaromyces stipitatus ATCC 10500]EED16670.1 importin 11, putative [Talaromyces stipitatus ATCC 10500]